MYKWSDKTETEELLPVKQSISAEARSHFVFPAWRLQSFPPGGWGIDGGLAWVYRAPASTLTVQPALKLQTLSALVHLFPRDAVRRTDFHFDCYPRPPRDVGAVHSRRSVWLRPWQVVWWQHSCWKHFSDILVSEAIISNLQRQIPAPRFLFFLELSCSFSPADSLCSSGTVAYHSKFLFFQRNTAYFLQFITLQPQTDVLHWYLMRQTIRK